MKKLTTGQLYGNLSHGNHYYDFFIRNEINNRKKVVQNDLKLAKINIKNLKNYNCMNVGTGRESLALSQIGAKKVFHYDISKEHVSRFKKIIKNKFKKNNIISKNADLCSYNLPKEYFDFVYLNGIVHHFSNVKKGLENCANSVKKNGYIWVYFYRSGTFKWFVCQMIRELIDKNNYENFFRNIANIYANGNTNDLIVSRIMDDFYAPYIHLYSFSNYVDFMQNLGFKKHAIINSSSEKDIDHQKLHHSSIIVFKKDTNSKISNKKLLNILDPKNSINQLNKTFYKKKKIVDAINLFNKILKYKKIPKNTEHIFSCIIGLHKIAAGQYYNGTELPPNYDKLNRVLENTFKNLSK